jgi:uncharacterized membrane protein
MSYRLAVVVTALWWGSLSTVGFIVVPLLFMHLANPRLAGAVAAQLFSMQSYLSAVCGLVLLVIYKPNKPLALVKSAGAATILIVTGMLLALLLEFAIAPRIVSVRAAGESLRFWHAVGSLMYAVQWLCVLALLWRLTLQPAPPPAVRAPH